MSRMCHLMDSLPKFNLHYSHRKLKDSLEKQAVLLIFLLELEIFGVTVQGIYQSSEKWPPPVRIFLVFLTVKKVGYRGTSDADKKSTEDILKFPQKGAITGPWWTLSTVEVRQEFTGFLEVTGWMV